eukprot:gene13806-13927_t
MTGGSSTRVAAALPKADDRADYIWSITRSDLGEYRAHVTDYVNFQVLEASSDQLDLFELAGWEQGLWFVCTVVNLAAFAFWVVYIFEIIQAEVDALRAQQEAAAEEGVVAYKNLLGPGQNMSHVPGADVEGGEITTVADQVKLTPGGADDAVVLAAYFWMPGLLLLLVVLACGGLKGLLPYLAGWVVVAGCQGRGIRVRGINQPPCAMDSQGWWRWWFVVTYSYLAALLWMFRPVEDSPYLLMGADIDHLDTSLGVEADEDAVEYPSSSSGGGGGGANGGPLGYPRAGGRSVEMTGHSGSPAGGNNSSQLGAKPGTLSAMAAGVGTAAGSALVGDLPLTLPAIRTSLGGGRPEAAAAGQQQQQQQPPRWSLGDEDELHEIKLHNLSPQKRD